MTKTEFLNTIAPLVQAENKKRGNPLFNSVVIGQAICESGWGQSTIMMKANAIFGIKATSSWKGKVYNANTKECYDGVNYTNINACFRAYNSLAESISDYFDLICKSSRYSKALNTNSPLECITAIKNGGYATSPTYINTIMSIINSNNLTKYDVENVNNNVDNKKSNEEIANDIINKPNYDGWGTGKTRKERLTNAGYNYIEIQEIINEKLGVKTNNTSYKINVGDKVKVINAVQYNGQPFKKYYDVYDVIEVKNDRIVIGIGKTITCAINISNLTKV